MTELINGRTDEEIKTALRVCPEDLCGVCPYPLSFTCVGNLISDALALIDRLESRIAELEAKQPRWISVTEDNKPASGYYNVMVNKRGVWQRDLLRYDADDDDWWKELSSHDELVPGYLITRYMQLPEPPKEDA